MTSDIRLCLFAAAAAFVPALAACSGTAIVESSATAVTVRYGGADGIAEATRLAQQACDRYHKTVRLRTTANFGLGERYGHFDCV